MEVTILTQDCYYMSDIYFIDGETLTPESFGKYDDNGVWIPLTSEESFEKIGGNTGFGPNGFFLDMAPDSVDNGGTTIMMDLSGNGNDFVMNGFNTFDPTDPSYDLMTDGPGQNFATLNPLYPNPSAVLSDANLSVTDNNGSYAPQNIATMKLDGKYYWEVTPTVAGASYPYVGVCILEPTTSQMKLIQQGLYVAADGGGGNFGTTISNNTYVTGDILGLAYDSSTRQLTVTINGANPPNFYGSGHS